MLDFTNQGTPLLSLRDLSVRFRKGKGHVHAVNGVDLDLAPGETVGLLGESGSGKSITLRSIMRLLPDSAALGGKISFDGQDVTQLNRRGLRSLRGAGIGMVFQEPLVAMDQTFTVGDQIVEAIRAHETISRGEARKRALELLELVQIPSARRRLDSFPQELSGGMRQRVMIAVALAARPRLLLADEPTTALDVTVQIQILLLLREIQREFGMAMIFVTHDIGVAAQVSDRLAVMYGGRIVESGPAGQLLAAPEHPYAEGLISAARGHRDGAGRLMGIPGRPPRLEQAPQGCSFAPRCPRAIGACAESLPELVATGRTDHAVACYVPTSRG
ncbi:ABC transporter ATP-binding protein [Salipiger bermudensis]|uniref:Oligopeptide/dipeptide ABC transporter, ATP-binding protein-like n=1 Tax=Salipiger bermudensis (strain DSM 26914 / JCM 13377 / KCTC 12554 / HTCC2601) TaxID=314265 RepID=Q0FUR8_SALBH|nr:ABC transporter ATP-binding protein [Salipiger bermudensis]EAU48013.1 Oligopeptide/dipeptide ABC transporter, ATP-binding protein-like [Salipiger bermudensis HTCC2601]